MKIIEKVKEYKTKAVDFILEKGCGCGRRKLSIKGVILVGLLIVILALT